jgi:hypothetical protein
MRSLASASLATLLVLPALSCAQEGRSAERQDRSKEPPASGQKSAQPHRGDQDRAQDDQAPRRLETVTWNSVRHELTWLVSKGDQKGASYKPTGTESYLINMDEATMTFNGEKRRFSREEAANVHVLMDVISKYAIDSTVWWDDGQGEPLDQHGIPKQTKPDKNRDRETDSVAILHVWAPAPLALKAGDVDRQIQALEDQLAELRRLRRLLGTTQLASY